MSLYTILSASAKNVAHNNSKRGRGSKAEKRSARSALKKRAKLGTTGKVDQRIKDLIDFADLMSWFEVASFERVRRAVAHVEKVYYQEAARLPDLPEGASDDDRRRARDVASTITSLIVRAQSSLSEIFAAIMAKAEQRFPGSNHPFFVRAADGRPLIDYISGPLLVPSIRLVRKVLWRLSIAATQGRDSVDLPIRVPTPRTTFRIRADGKVEPVIEERQYADLNDLILDAVSSLPDVRRLRICWLRERRKGNHACGRIFWAQRDDRRECSRLHRDLRRKTKDRKIYEERRRRKGLPDTRTSQEVLDLHKTLRAIQREVDRFTGR